MNIRIVYALLTAAFISTATAAISPEVRQANFSLSRNHLALSGYDPVSYFQMGPLKGSKTLSHTHRGITYRFANEANRATFQAAPSKYEPQYGGWCAWAMYDGGERTKVNPESYTITDGKLYVFYDTFLADTLQYWNDAAAKSSEAALILTADRYWKNQVGE